MKKLLFAFLFTASIFTSAFATDETSFVTRAKQNFESNFALASNVTWVITDNFTKASFVEDEKKFEVYYDLKGDYLVTTSEILPEKIPTSVKRVIAKKYTDYLIQEAFMFEGDNDTSYFVSLYNHNEKIILQSEKGSTSIYSRDTLN